MVVIKLYIIFKVFSLNTFFLLLINLKILANKLLDFYINFKPLNYYISILK